MPCSDGLDEIRARNLTRVGRLRATEEGGGGRPATQKNPKGRSQEGDPSPSGECRAPRHAPGYSPRRVSSRTRKRITGLLGHSHRRQTRLQPGDTPGPARRLCPPMRGVWCPAQSVSANNPVGFRPRAFRSGLRIGSLSLLSSSWSRRSEWPSYSITWSARSRSACGIVRPRALTVLRLTTSSNLVGCSIGRSAGRAPLRIRST